VGCILLSTVAVIGAGVAFKMHQPYLGTRLIGLSGAALFGTLTAPRMVETARTQPRTTIAIGIVLGVLLSLLLALVLFPDRIFRFLAWLAGNPRAKTPF
jgi:hypothetical protein